MKGNIRRRPTRNPSSHRPVPGTAWLKSKQYAHGDIRPHNLLLDDKDHLKLTDFGSAAKYGSHLEVGTPLYARWHSVEIGDEDNSLGDHGSNV